VEEKLAFYNAANREVAILCNHQKSVSKNFDQQMERMQDRVRVTPLLCHRPPSAMLV
jgi:DNA topoisomerase-1